MRISRLEEKCLNEINVWEKNYVNKKQNNLMKKTFKEIEKFSEPIMEKINIDDKIAKAIETSIMGCMNLAQDVVAYTYDKEKSIKKLKDSQIRTLDDLYKADVTELSPIAKGVIKENKIIATLEGLALGMGDLTMAIADIPLFFAVTFRVMQQIASVYGYDPEDEKEKLFIIKLMSFGSAMEPAGKLAIQAEILAIKAGIKRYTFKQMQDMGGKFAVVLTARQVAKNCGSRLTRNTLLKGVPIIGGAFGATFNYEFINKIANVTNKMYQKRFLEDKLELEDIESRVAVTIE